MFRRYLDNLYIPPDTAAATGGTTVTSTAASVTGGATEPTTSGVSSGTASEAMIKAAMAASSAETPAVGATSADTPAQAVPGTDGATPDATAQVATDGTSAATEKPGYLPQARHDAILKNARRDTEASVRKEYGNLKPQQLHAAWTLAREIKADPEAFYHKLGESLGLTGSPAAPVSRSAASTVALEPGLRSEDGKTAYTADQVRELLTNHGGEIRATVMQELKPLLQFFTSESGRREQETQSRRNSATADSVLKTAEALPYFKENRAIIGEKLKAMDADLKRQLGPVGAMYHAYNTVLQESVYPNMDKSAEDRVRASFAKKAAGSGGVHPGGSTGGDGKKPQLDNVSQLAAHMANLATAGV